VAELYDAGGEALGDPNAAEPLQGRTDADRAAEIEAASPGTETAAAVDPAVLGTTGGQSGGRAYEHPEIGHFNSGHASGGQSNPGYSGTGRLAGALVEPESDINAVTRSAHKHKIPRMQPRAARSYPAVRIAALIADFRKGRLSC